MSGFDARPLTPADGAAWHALLLAGTREAPDGFVVSPEEVEAMDAPRVEAALKRGTMHGVFEGGVLKGFGGLSRSGTRRTAHRGTVGPFYVAPEARGRKAADALMVALEAAARAGGVTQLLLWVHEQNGRAQRFFARHAFEPIGRVPDATVMEDGATQADLILLRSL